MPSPMKPGVDWAAIETRFRAGESANVIAKDFPISRQRIEARAKKRNWRPKTELRLPTLRRGVQAMMDRDWEPLPMWLRFVDTTETAARLKDPQSPSDRQLVDAGKCSRENLARMLGLVAEGNPKSIAARCVGVHPDTLATWLRVDSGLAELFGRAQAFVAFNRVSKLGEQIESGDASSIRFALSHDENTREHFRKSSAGRSQGQGEITVTFNLSPPLSPEEWEKKHGKAQGVVIEGNAKDMTTQAIPDHRAAGDDTD